MLGRKFLRPAVQNLADLGIDFELNPGAGLNKATIDTGKLSAKYPELDNMSREEQLSWLSEKFSIPEDALRAGNYHGHFGFFDLDTSNFPLSADKALANSSLSELDDGTIVSALNNRIFSNYLNISSLFHPISRAAESQLKKLNTVLKDKATVDDEEETLQQPIEDQANGAVSDVDSEESTFGNPVMKSLLITGGACFMRGTASDINTINRDRISTTGRWRGSP